MYRPTAGLCQRVLQSEIYHLLLGYSTLDSPYSEYSAKKTIDTLNTPRNPQRNGVEKNQISIGFLIKIYVDGVDCKCIAYVNGCIEF